MQGERGFGRGQNRLVRAPLRFGFRAAQAQHPGAVEHLFGQRQAVTGLTQGHHNAQLVAQGKAFTGGVQGVRSAGLAQAQQFSGVMVDGRAVGFVQHQHRGSHAVVRAQQGAQAGQAHQRNAGGRHGFDLIAQAADVGRDGQLEEALASQAQRCAQRAGKQALAAPRRAGQQQDSSLRKADEQVDRLVVCEGKTGFFKAHAQIAHCFARAGRTGCGGVNARLPAIEQGGEHVTGTALQQLIGQLAVQLLGHQAGERRAGQRRRFLGALGLLPRRILFIAQGRQTVRGILKLAAARLLDLSQQLGAGLLPVLFEPVDVADQLETVGFHLRQLFLSIAQRARLNGVFAAGQAQHLIHVAQLEQTLYQAGAGLRQFPDRLHGLHGAIKRVVSRNRLGVAGHRVAQLIHAGAPPHVVQHFLDAGAAAGVEAALLVCLARLGGAGRGRRSLRLQPGLGFGRLPALPGTRLALLGAIIPFAPLGLFGFLCLLGGRPFRRRLFDGVGALSALGGRNAEMRQIHQQAARRGLFGLHLEQAAGERLQRLLDRHGVLGQQAGAGLLRRPAVQADQAALLGEGDIGRARLGNQAITRRAVCLHHFGQAQGRDGEDHVGIHDEGVSIPVFGRVVLVRPDFVVVAWVVAQIQQAVAPQLAHAGLEVAQFVFVRHDADIAVVLKLFRDVFRPEKGFAVLDDQRAHPEIKLLRVVLLQKANRELSR